MYLRLAQVAPQAGAMEEESDFAAEPCLRAFCAEVALPAAVLGPVLFFAFALLQATIP